MTHAFGYVRVSGKGQLRKRTVNGVAEPQKETDDDDEKFDGHGPKRQAKLIEEFAAKKGYEIKEFYKDVHTGTEADRPRMTAMLADIMGNGVRVVILESLDRLARDLMVQTQLLAKFASLGVKVIVVNTGEDVTAAMHEDPMRKAMVQIQGVFAELDKNLTVRKLRKARQARKAETGRCEGRKPYGFYLNEGPVLDKMLSLARKRKPGKLSFEEIAGVLNRAGMRNRSGGEWTKGMVRKVLVRVKGRKEKVTG